MANSSSSQLFNALKDTANEATSTIAPKAMLQYAAQVDTSRRDLNDQETKAAVEQLSHKGFVNLDFPKKMKVYRDPPISGQLYSLHSFLPAPGAKPDKDGVYGILKNRGCFPTEELGDKQAEEILRRVDSTAVIDWGWVGCPMPLMKNNERYRAATREIDIRKPIDDQYRSELKKAREAEQREQAEIMRRQRELMKPASEEKEIRGNDLDFYTCLQTKKAQMKWLLEDLKKKRAEYEKNLEAAEEEIKQADQDHPEWKEQYKARYKEGLRAVGIEDHSAALLKHMQ